jgi:hypothetical protein
MTIPDDKAERADGPSNAELAEHLRGMAEWISERGGWQSDDIEWVYIAAARLEARSEISEAWKEATIAWACCASLHREYAKGKDALYTTRQADFVRHGGKARAALEAALSGKEE